MSAFPSPVRRVQSGSASIFRTRHRRVLLHACRPVPGPGHSGTYGSAPQMAEFRHCGPHRNPEGARVPLWQNDVSCATSGRSSPPAGPAPGRSGRGTAHEDQRWTTDPRQARHQRAQAGEIRMPIAAAIERSIDVMWQHHANPISLEQLAEIAAYSKFHYCRMFNQLTGTSPGRFLTAIRIYMAKRHLLETPDSVTDITYRVGYNSLGTFTSRFTRSVGVSPTRYRSLAQGDDLPPLTPPAARSCHGLSVVTGQLYFPPSEVGPVRVYVGAFNTPIVEGYPQACDVLDEARPFRLQVPDGLWFIRAAAVATEDDSPGQLLIRPPRLVGSGWAVRARGGRAYSTDVQLRDVTALDLPILLALPELDGARRIPQAAAR
ncbi:helix-turn-helix transcriptional regulator [Kitasatospora sp. NPDC059795]|uniref:helix-turn-helix transcriptional regulator n=1 Tax=Kitasatospora sp. NPDC059795 TaxID=3346949 RepID=UPI0036673DB4